MNLRDVLLALRYGSEKVEDPTKMLFAEGRYASKWQEIRTDPFYQDYLNEIYEQGKKFSQEPIKEIPFSLYKIFDETGSRKEFEKEYFARRSRLETFSLLLLLENEREDYVKELEDTIWAICNEYTWCLPAHLHGRSKEIIKNEKTNTDGKISGFLREHENEVDLFSAETGFALAEILSFHEDKMEPLVVYRARKEIKERILEPYKGLNAIFGWETVPMNWAAVCSGSVGAAAMYLIEDDAILAPFIYRIMGTMESFLSGFGDDGACTEGLSYWNYGFSFFVYFAELLKQRTLGKINLLDKEKIKEIVLFQEKCFLSENKVISYSDAARENKFCMGLTHHLKDIYAEMRVPPIKYRAGTGYKWPRDVRDLVWSNKDYEGQEPEETSYYLEDAEWIISRKRTNKGMVAFTAKGGHNGEPHNHNDIGSFIFHVAGEPLLIDPGSGEYTKQYFGPARYSFLCNGSQGHSVPIINGEYQKEGKDFAAWVLGVERSAECDQFVLDIAGAYTEPDLNSWIRKFAFYKEGNVRLEIEDEYNFEQLPESLIERFVTLAKPEVTEGKVNIKGERGSVALTYDPAKLECSVQKESYINHNSENEDVYLIDFKVKNPARMGKINIIITPE